MTPDPDAEARHRYGADPGVGACPCPRVRAEAVFSEAFGGTAGVVASAPGRVNLIGEHTDYNEGLVLPMALEQRTVFSGRSRSGGGVSRFCFPDLAPEGTPVVDFVLSPVFDSSLTGPARYLSAIYSRVWHGLAPERREALPRAVEGVVSSAVPIGAGLSSSAAFEVSFAMGLLALAGVSDMAGERVALLAQAAEHDVGVPCGIMDQFISVLGRPGCALLIDCRDRSWRAVEVSGAPVSFVVADSGVKHRHVAGAYAERRAQCEDAVSALRARFGGRIRALRDAGAGELETARAEMSRVVFQRARHVVGEIGRTAAAAGAFSAGDFVRAGSLMTESHASLRDDYGVSCPELDALVESALACPGVYGSRLTGGGFGGCTVTLVEESRAAELIEAMVSGAERAGLPAPTCFVSRPSGGARVEPGG